MSEAAHITRNRISGRKLLNYLLRYAILLVLLIIFLFPVYWMFTMAFKTPNEYFRIPPLWLPPRLSLNHFINIINGGNIRSLWNSLIIASGATLLALLVGLPAAYSLARYKTGGENLSFFILSQRFLPPVAFIIPIFIMFRFLKFIDTYHGLILLYAAFNLPFVIWMMRGYVTEVPIEIEESAKVDGASTLGVLWRITLPLSSAGIIATSIFTFIFIWNEFLFGLVLTRSNVRTLPVILSSYFGPQSSFWGEAAAMSMIATIPVVIMTLFTNRYLVRGLTLGAIK